MRFFVKDNERKNTNYHEFYKGRWDGVTFGKEDSLSLHDDIMFLNPGFVDAIIEVIPSYDPFGETEISLEEWENIGLVIKNQDDNSIELYNEADVWLREAFKEYGCFTIIGI